MYVFPPKVLDNVGHELANMAKSIASFAEAVLEESRLRHTCCEKIVRNEELYAELEAAKMKVAEMRQICIESRIAMFTCIDEATLTPRKGYRIDPHSLAPCLAGDLVNAVVIPQSITLVTDGSANDLLSDFSPQTFSEIARLAKRLDADAEEEVASTTTSATPPLSTETSSYGKGSLSNAIALAHLRLDEAGIPS